MGTWWLTPERTRHGLPPEHRDTRLERAGAGAVPASARRGSPVKLRVWNLRPESEEGPVDLTIYTLQEGAPYEVLVEATLHPVDGRATFEFRSIEEDRRGRYLAVFRRTDASSRPVARCSFTLR